MEKDRVGYVGSSWGFAGCGPSWVEDLDEEVAVLYADHCEMLGVMDGGHGQSR